MRLPPLHPAAGDAPRASRRWRAPARRSVAAPRGRPGSKAMLLRNVGAAILVGGWLAAGAVLAWSPEAPDADAVNYRIVGGRVYPIPLADSRRRKLQVQRMEGDMGVWITGVDAGLRSFFRPPRLGWTILLLSTALGIGCLRLSALSGEDI